MIDPLKMINDMNKKISKSFNIQGFSHLNSLQSFGSSKRDMNFVQGFFTMGLNPFKDSDRDGVPNLFDCKPFDKSRQDLTVFPPKEGEGTAYYFDPVKFKKGEFAFGYTRYSKKKPHLSRGTGTKLAESILTFS